MNPKTKKFLIQLTGVALAGWIGVNWLLGPPGYSSEYLSEHGVAHEHYLEAVKNNEYKRYTQRPHLFDLEERPELKQRVDFVSEYTATEAFQAEQHRIHLYSLFFEFFNTILVVVLAVRFAKAPLLTFLDNQIEELREKMSQSARSRKSALGRRAAIEEKLARIDDEELKVAAGTERRLEREMAELAEANHYSLGLQERETAERKKAELHKAELDVKRRLVDDAIAVLIEEARQRQTEASQEALVRQFARDVEAAP